MVYAGDKKFDSWEELGNHILNSLPNEKQPVKWWRKWSITKFGYRNYLPKTKIKKIIVCFPQFGYDRSWVGLVWIHIHLFNRWDFMFSCGDYKFKED